MAPPDGMSGTLHDGCIRIDGSAGEGGGQILRTALGLSLVTGKPFVMENIRAGRHKPGLMRQHLTAILAAKTISNAGVQGAEIGSRCVSFEPTAVMPGEYRFSIGTAGSATLVLQTVLHALVLSNAPSHLFIEGGTHNPYAPPFDFLCDVFSPIIGRMGADVKIKLLRHGFYPAGGGLLEVAIQPCRGLHPIDLLERGKLVHVQARALLAGGLDSDIGKRELQVVKRELIPDDQFLQIVDVKDSDGPGNALLVEVKHEGMMELFSAFGELGKAAESVAKEAVTPAAKYLRSMSPVGPYLADQLLIPFALAQGGCFRTAALSRHSRTNMEIIRKFLEVEISVKELEGREVEVRVRKAL